MANKEACGTIFLSKKTGRVLLNLRAPNKTYHLKWSLWGGMIEEGETPKECLLREMSEEMGFIPNIDKIYPFDVYESKDKNFRYYSFICIVDDEFNPILNDESVGYCWCKLGIWPTPMHEGARITLCNEDSLNKLNTILAQYQ
jgi:ADP-ribose pyrophosphatase YjhB (NUDIX family)